MSVDAAEKEEVLLSRVLDGTCILTLNRPQRLNALNVRLLQELAGAIARCGHDDAVRAVLITGAGRAFCAGQDLEDRDPRKIPWPPQIEKGLMANYYPVIAALRSLRKPAVIAVNGIAAGAGCSIALAGDIVLAARSAQFIQSFAKVGLSVDAGGGWHLVRALGPAKARGLLMTGGSLAAAEAESAGLIWKCVEDDALLPEALALASRLAKGPTRAYAAIKAAVTAAESASTFEAYFQEEARIQGEIAMTHDYREGVLAFLEKRPADFKGE
jgi:2-(1,2-epoxy-1,2-dihydrophenyl)acetyl-CoA isomerase